MNAQELFTYLTDGAGLDDATAKAIMAAAANEKVAAKAGTLKQQKDLDDLNARLAQVQEAYEGKGGAWGAKQYQQWVAENHAAIIKLQNDVARYQERYGALDGAAPGTPAPKPGVGPMSNEDVQKLIHETIQNTYANRWSDLLTTSGTLIERHMRAGRKTPIDWKKVGELATAKGGDLNLAYDEWDKPEADAARQAETQKEVDRRVKEELAKRATQGAFPAGADGTPSSTSTLGITRAAGEHKYDRSKVVAAATTGQYDGGQAAA